MLLVTVTGRDRPGLTSSLFDALAHCAAEVRDVEQVVIRERLTLGVLIDAADETAARAALAGFTRQQPALTVDVETGDEPPPRGRTRHHVTVLGDPLTAAAISGIATRIAECGANIERIARLSRLPAMSLELLVAGGDLTGLRAALAAEAATQRVDVAVQRATLLRRATRLVCLDVDSTLIQGEVIELLAAEAGCLAEVARVTELAMRGELDFATSLRRRVALLAGLDAAAVEGVTDRLRLTPGAQTLVRTLKRLGYRVGIVSGGFTQVTDVLVERLGLDFAAANTLEIADGRLTGGLVGEVVDRPGKAAALRRFAAAAGVPLSQTVAVGDGANDLDMLAVAGLGIAFNAKPVVVAAADTAVSVPYLDAVLFLLGITREEVEAADAEQPRA